MQVIEPAQEALPELRGPSRFVQQRVDLIARHATMHILVYYGIQLYTMYMLIYLYDSRRMSDIIQQRVNIIARHATMHILVCQFARLDMDA